MARQRKLSPDRKEFINSLLEHYKPNDARDVQDMLKDLLGDTRNGYSKKTVTSSMEPITLDIPRDREGTFEPQAVKKNETDVSTIEDQVLSM